MFKKLLAFVLSAAILVSMLATFALADDRQQADAYELGGNITEDTILNGTKQPYILKSDINIKAGVRLTIGSGVKIDGQGNEITAYGALNIDHASLENVIINTANTGNQNAELIVTNSTFTGCGIGSGGHAKLIVRDNQICDGGLGYIWYPSEDAYIERNIFDGCYGMSIGSDHDVFINNNVFVNVQGDCAIEDWAQYSSNCYVRNNSFLDEGIMLRLKYDSGKMDAVSNWWNTTDEAEVAKRIYDGTVDYDIPNMIPYLPILSGPHADTPVYVHTHHYQSRTTPPTCTEKGYTTHTCKCGDSYVDTYVAALGHKWGAWTVTKAATQTAEGSEVRTCSQCGDSQTRTTPKLTPKPDDTKPSPKPISNPFTDVKNGDYFFDPVLWALNHDPQITDGTSDTTFSPDATCTRGQVVTFLWRAMGCEEPTKTDNPFRDVKSGDYFYMAVLWAVEKGITDGTSATTFSPNDPCTRAHVVTFLWRAENKPAAGSNNPFKDVARGAYYFDPVLWAVEKGITDGTSDTTFSPDADCTRGQIVTFLYRDMK